MIALPRRYITYELTNQLDLSKEDLLDLSRQLYIKKKKKKRGAFEFVNDVTKRHTGELIHTFI